MPDGEQTRLYCCHSMLTRDAAAVSHVLSVGVDLSPALSAQGYDEAALVQSVAEACRKGGGDAPIPAEAKRGAAHRLEGAQHRLDRRCAVS